MVLPSKPESLYFLFPEDMFCCFVFFWGVLFSGSLCQAPETLWTCSQGCHCPFFLPTNVSGVMTSMFLLFSSHQPLQEAELGWMLDNREVSCDPWPLKVACFPVCV